MKAKFLIYNCLLVFFINIAGISHAHAQNQCTINGVVKMADSTLEYATVQLFRGDSILQSTISDTRGEFHFTTSPGTCTLVASYLGLAQCDTTFNAIPGRNSLEILLIERSELLEDIVVKGTRQYFERKADRFILKYSGNPFFEDKSVAEALASTPMIIKRNDNFVISGKESTTIYINGKPTMLSGDALNALLDTKQADEVDHLEIITNPPAQYDASDQSGIINIILKRGGDMGFMTTLGVKATKGERLKLAGNGLMAYKTGGLSINFFANASSFKSKRSSSTFYNNTAENAIKNEISKID